MEVVFFPIERVLLGHLPSAYFCFSTMHFWFFNCEAQLLEHIKNCVLRNIKADLLEKKQPVLLQLVSTVLVEKIQKTEDFTFPHLHYWVWNRVQSNCIGALTEQLDTKLVVMAECDPKKSK